VWEPQTLTLLNAESVWHDRKSFNIWTVLLQF